MKKTLVLYYSKTGSNKFLAEKISENLDSDIERIRPRMNVFMLLMLFTSMSRSVAIKPIKRHLHDYDQIILCSPIWIGKIISPIRGFFRKYLASIENVFFVTCCGSSDAKKDEKFGHGLVFRDLDVALGEKCKEMAAFPIDLVLSKELKENDHAIMNTRLSEDNFKGEIVHRFDLLINKIKDAGQNF